MKRIPVCEIMSRKPVVARGDQHLPELVALMRASRLRSLPVVDDSGRLIGVVTESDLFLRPKGVPFSFEKLPSILGQIVVKDELDQVDLCKKVRVEEVMTSNVTAVGEDTALQDVAMLMYERKLTLVPVVAEGKLAGVVRRIDLLEIIYGAGPTVTDESGAERVPDPARV